MTVKVNGVPIEKMSEEELSVKKKKLVKESIKVVMTIVIGYALSTQLLPWVAFLLARFIVNLVGGH